MQSITIGRLAELAGVHLETIRYYERIGLMPEPGRTSGGYRSYGDGHVRRLSFIRRARELGFGVEEVRALLGLAEPGQTSCTEVRALTLVHLDDVRTRIADLRRLESILAETVDLCSETNTPACPVLDMLNEQSAVTKPSCLQPGIRSG